MTYRQLCIGRRYHGPQLGERARRVRDRYGRLHGALLGKAYYRRDVKRWGWGGDF